ncbi:MAG: hypothetical protein ABEH64_09720, partial [Salinirussus sp.]
MDRAQAPLSIIEAGIGLLILVALGASFVVAAPAAPPEHPQLDAYAEDALVILDQEPPRHAGETRLREVIRSATSFDREKDALRRRTIRILPENLMFRMETPYGLIGHRLPDGVPMGTAS